MFVKAASLITWPIAIEVTPAAVGKQTQKQISDHQENFTWYILHDVFYLRWQRSIRDFSKDLYFIVREIKVIAKIAKGFLPW